MTDERRGAVDELRRAFDASFARAPTTGETPHDDLLAIRIGSHPYAVRLADVSEVLVDREVTRLPGRCRNCWAS